MNGVVIIQVVFNKKMPKTKITVTTVGHLPPDFDKQKVKKWKSSVFEVVDGIESYSLSKNSDAEGWAFTDTSLETVLPRDFSGDFLIAIVNVPLEFNWYTRRLSGNRIVFTFYEIKDILREANIPLENVIYRVLYAYTLKFKRSGNRIPKYGEETHFNHDETRGCLFDMNGIKDDVIYSCNNPIICSDCVAKLRNERISDETISSCQNEIKKIKKELFYRMADFIKRHPILSLLISGLTAVVLGTIGSLIASVIYEAINTVNKPQ
jgi:hypothetical protein